MKNLILILCCIFILPACSLYKGAAHAFTTENVEPWQRDILAQDSMQLIRDAMQSYADDHSYFSKEAATGGKGIGRGGGGCK